MDIPSSIAIISLAALIHSSFQLSVSMLTLLSGHLIGNKRSHAKLLRTTAGFIIGAGFMTMLILSFISLMLLNIFSVNTPPVVWSVVCGLSVGVAIAIWLFYYQRESGTTLWIPRGIANYLTSRIKATKLSAEAFGLGLSSVVGEILFIIAPISISALVIIQLPAYWQLAGIFLYTIISVIPLLIIWVMIGGGHLITNIQKWRENNKRFLQFIGSAGLIILSFFVYTSEILGHTLGGF